MKKEMTLRPDEARSMLALASHLGLPDAAVRPGEDPPDAYLNFGSSEVGVEVTKLFQMSFDDQGQGKNRHTEDMFAIRLAHELNETLGPAVPDDRLLLLHLQAPTKHPAKVKKLTFAWVEREMTNFTSSSWHKTQLIDVEVAGKLLKRSDGEPKRIVAIVSNNDSNADILFNANAMLKHRIEDKEQKFQKMPSLSRRWLLLQNEYWLADPSSFQMAMDAIKNEMHHNFERIFIHSHDNRVSELNF